MKDPCQLRAEFQSTFGGDFGYDVLSGYADDMKAIRLYFDQTPVRTPEAQKIKDDFIRWYDAIWFATEANYDLARNQRNRFNLANATTPEEKQATQTVIETGLSSEQLQNEADRRLQGGMLPGPVVPPKPSWIPTEWKVVGAIVGTLAIVATAYGYGRR